MMRVALTMRQVEADGYHEPRDAISQDWIDYLTRHGIIPLLVPNLVKGITQYLDNLNPDLILLTGGDDLGVTPRRDEAERIVLEHGIKRDIPVLGVCRGLHLINQLCNGSIRPMKGHVATTHKIRTTAPLSDIYGETVDVNSYHTLGFKEEDIGDDLSPVAWDEDGMVEAVVHNAHRIAAVMWHPERAGSPENDIKLIRRLIGKEEFKW